MRQQVALVGAGAMGTIMARDIYPCLAPEITVAAVVDRDADRAEALAADLGVRAFTTLADAVAHEHLDGADIRVPHGAHAEAALEAIALGLHVLVEKPLALSLQDCDRIAQAGAAADRVVAVAENYPHLQAVRAARSAIDAGRVGEVLALRSTRAYTLAGVWAASAWRRGDEAMAGLLWDQATHHISLLRALAGPVATVAAHRSTGRSTPGAEVYSLDLTFASGLLAQSLYCWGTPARAVEVEATVLGSTGMIDIGVDYDSDGGSARLVIGAEAVPLSAPECYYDSHAAIVRDWVAAVRDDAAPLVPPASARADVAVVLAAQASLAAGGAPVSP
ncbi:Gfo/Idh/MocA family protein [Pseudactinotalea terrae]|uniref:Gfo/Idh/MocA family protein n=1 Tax=Pseudactinotalea terrae TaxID=1743262 RepID=UPI0012E14C72|nr:Gfo/Idh/MocA family oxidoreductase [Pseudactinotalea terrae]